MVDPLDPASAERIQQIPMVYFNGFAIGLSNADVSFLIKIDNRPTMELKASYTVMKTLAEGLAHAMEKFEKMTDHNLMTTEFVEKAIKAAAAEEEK